jgi:hypothetical protein
MTIHPLDRWHYQPRASAICRISSAKVAAWIGFWM